MKKQMLFLLLAAVVVIPAFSENKISLKKVELIWSVEEDELTISMTAETKGWMAVGLGSSRMDGSIMFLGYNKDGEAFFEEHLGRGHSHKKASEQRPVEFSVDEENGTTVMELTVKKSDFVKAGDTLLPVIVAYGNRDNFNSMHRYRDSTEIIF